MSAGTAFRGPPLLLPLLAPTARHATLYSIPFILADLLSALCLLCIASRVYASSQPTKRASPTSPPAPRSAGSPQIYEGGGTAQAGAQQGQEEDSEAARRSVYRVAPATVAALYLWSPYAIGVCVAGGTGALSTASVLVGVLGAVEGAPVATALGCAAAAYLNPLHLLLAVRFSPYRVRAHASSAARRQRCATAQIARPRVNACTALQHARPTTRWATAVCAWTTAALRMLLDACTVRRPHSALRS